MRDERFIRLERLVGAKRFARLRRSFVVVAGLGAMGSFAVEALARSGVGRLRLVDFDVLRMLAAAKGKLRELHEELIEKA